MYEDYGRGSTAECHYDVLLSVIICCHAMHCLVSDILTVAWFNHPCRACREEYLHAIIQLLMLPFAQKTRQQFEQFIAQISGNFSLKAGIQRMRLKRSLQCTQKCRFLSQEVRENRGYFVALTA